MELLGHLEVGTGGNSRDSDDSRNVVIRSRKKNISNIKDSAKTGRMTNI